MNKLLAWLYHDCKVCACHKQKISGSEEKTVCGKHSKYKQKEWRCVCIACPVGKPLQSWEVNVTPMAGY